MNTPIKLAMSAILAVSLSAQADVLPTSAVMVARSATDSPCISSYWFSYMTYRWNSFNNADQSRCGEAMLDVEGNGVFANATVNLHNKTIIALTFPQAVQTITVRRCFGCGDVLNQAGEVDVSADQVTWKRTNGWTRDIAAEGPTRVAWYAGARRDTIAEESTVVLATASQVIYVRGVKTQPTPTQKWLPTILSVKGR